MTKKSKHNKKKRQIFWSQEKLGTTWGISHEKKEAPDRFQPFSDLCGAYRVGAGGFSSGIGTTKSELDVLGSCRSCWQVSANWKGKVPPTWSRKLSHIEEWGAEKPGVLCLSFAFVPCDTTQAEALCHRAQRQRTEQCQGLNWFGRKSLCSLPAVQSGSWELPTRVITQAKRGVLGKSKYGFSFR